METIKTVFEKVALNSNKYEFATVKSIIKQAEKISNNINEASISLDNAADKSEDGFKSAEVQLKSLNESINESLKMVKDLGVDIPKELNDAIQSAKISAKNISKGFVRAKNAKI